MLLSAKVLFLHVAIFHGERLTIVLTRMDTQYTYGSTESSNPERMKKTVSDTVWQTTGTYVSPDIVFPISSLWAIQVRD